MAQLAASDWIDPSSRDVLIGGEHAIARQG